MSEQPIPSAEDNAATRSRLLRERLAGARKAVSASQRIPRLTRVAGSRTVSFGQQRLYYVYELYPDSQAYHLQLNCRLDGPLAEERLQRALAEVVDRHETLHSVVRLQDGELVSLPRKEIRLETAVEDITGLDTMSQQHAVQKRIDVDGQLRFDLQHDLPIRTVILKRSPTWHELVLTFHHIAVDEHSLVLILQQTAALYSDSDRRAETFEPAASEELRYSDFASWQRGALKDTGASERYWRERLQNPLTEIPLPVDHALPQNREFRGQLVSAVVPLGVADDLRRLAAAQSVTPFILQLAAFYVLLHRYSGVTDLTVGTPVSSRTHHELSDVVGFFVETLPLRADLSGEPTFAELLKHVRITFTEALQHADLPFEEIVRAVNPQRSSRRNPLFNAMIVARTSLPAIEAGDGLTLTPRILDSGASKFDLTLFVGDLSHDREVTIEYSTELFRPETVERLQKHWLKLLSSIADDPHVPISRLNLLSEDEQRKLVAEMTAGGLPDLPAECIHHLIEHQAHLNPDAVAIRYEQRPLTYAELNAQADRLSQRLTAEGIGRGECVAVCTDRSPAMLVAIPGILKTGAAYVPVDPSLPHDRRRLILQNCQANAVVTHSPHAALFDSFQGSVVVLRKDVSPDHVPFSSEGGNGNAGRSTVMMAGRSGNQPGDETDIQTREVAHTRREDIGHSVPAAESLAYVMFTSGSTGIPKGVEVTHRNLVQSTAARFDYYPDSPDRFLLLSPYSFDSSVAGIFWTLCGGGTLVLPPSELVHDVLGLADLIAAEQVTHILCLPSLYELLLDHAAENKLTSLRTVIVAGDACSPEVVDKHFTRLATTGLYNEYGPTEATVWSTVHKVTAADRYEVPIGNAVPGTSLCLLDEHGQPVPTGVPGEIYIGGPQIARGYRDRPDLTSDVFVHNPFSDDPSSRLYRTGDRGKQRADGSYVYLGRVDNQLKVNGHRVEAEEIEAAIVAHPAVRQAVVGEAAIGSPARVTADVASLVSALERLPDDEVETLLKEVESRKDLDTVRTDTNNGSAFRLRHADNGVGVTLELPGEDYIGTPRSGQRKWLLNQALNEVTSDLRHLHQVARHFVPGSPDRHTPHDIRSKRLTEQEIMEDWQYPLVEGMTRYATESHGDILEIGFGRGVSATMIQKSGVRSHTIIEANRHSVVDHFQPWKQQFPGRDIRMIEGRWQDVLSQLEEYDGIFFHAFPLNEAEFVDYVVNSVTFAEHFFPTAANLLRNEGVFTYLTTEIDSLSRRHQRSLFRHFREVRMNVVPLSVPPDTKDAWWSNSMIVLCAVK